MEFVPLVALGALVKKVVDTLKYATNGLWNRVLTQLATWAGGFFAVWLASESNWSDGIEIGDQVLGRLNLASLVFVGMTVASVGGVIFHDIPNRLDPTVKTDEPSLKLSGSKKRSKKQQP